MCLLNNPLLFSYANALLGIADSEMVENNNTVMEQEIKNNMFAEPLLLEFGEGLIDYVKAGLETGYVNQQKKGWQRAQAF